MAVEKLPTKDKSKPATLDDIGKAGSTLAETFYKLTPYKDKNRKLIGCAENLKILLQILEATVRYNVISKEVEINIPGNSYSLDNAYNASLALIASKLKEVSMPTDFHREYLLLIADKNPYNPVQNWILSKEWDGVSRLQEFYDTITTTPENKAAKEAFIYRWMIGAVAAACSPNGVDSTGVLVLQGLEGLGKTYWFRKLVPKEELPDVTRSDASVDPHDKDSVEQVVCHWLVELGELDSTFKKSEVSALKAFITRDHDVFRKSYAPRPSKYPRRTAFVASVNPWYFLVDEGGNRRFWTIECLAVDSYHTINMQQVWREIYDKWEAGDTHRMNDAEKGLLKDINETHLPTNPLVEKIMSKFDWDEPEMGWQWKTATEILEDCGVVKPNTADTRICADTIRKLNGNKTERKTKGRLLKVPSKITP